MTDLYKSFRQDMLLKTTQEFCMLQDHYFLFMAICIILVPEANMALIYVQNPVSGDGYFMCIAAQVFDDLRRAAKRSVGMYILFLFACHRQHVLYLFPICKM